MEAARRLGPWLVFCIVYADIGTSVFYVPGILYGNPHVHPPTGIGELATLAQLLTLGVFVLIARKYAEICARCPDGGGVVSIAEQAFPSAPTLALVGGAMITIDYFLTSAISGVSGIYYLQSVANFPRELVVPITIACMLGLIVLNIVGLKESASVTAAMTVAMIIVNLVLIALASVRITAEHAWGRLFDQVFHPDVKLTPTTLLIGYANTWLAYSGLESGAQVSGAMADPTRKTASRAMWGVIFAIAIMSPALTAFSINRLPEEFKVSEPEAYISQLAYQVAQGRWLQALTVVSATLLLLMACNTALVGNYHVNSRLTSAGFLPRVLARRHRKYGTPYISIIISASVPILVLMATWGDVTALGDLYSFGLLGTLVISSVSVDVLRWKEHGNPFQFLGGSFTTGALLLAWLINLVHKPDATLFGGGLTTLMVVLGISYRRGWIPKVAAPAPVVTSWREAERAAGLAPEAAKVLTLEEAIDLKPLESSSIMVALRGLNERLLEDAAWLAKGRGERSVYVVVVDEVPGLFMPHEIAPTEEATSLLSRAYEVLQRKFGLLALPVWRIGNDAAKALAEAATELKVGALIVGTTKRSAIWHLMRGNVLKGLLKNLPAETRLLISS
jgi:amino acid transporter/nucleotide-binding universal stress UspA family protein